MTVGISAPPIGMMSSTPKTSDRTTISGKSCHVSGRAMSTTLAMSAVPSSARLVMFWPRYVIGRVGMTS
jgi:hypothetical protein